MKHQVKHLHFIADDIRNGLGHCPERPRWLAQTPANAGSVTYEA